MRRAGGGGEECVPERVEDCLTIRETRFGEALRRELFEGLIVECRFERFGQCRKLAHQSTLASKKSGVNHLDDGQICVAGFRWRSRSCSSIDSTTRRSRLSSVCGLARRFGRGDSSLGADTWGGRRSGSWTAFFSGQRSEIDDYLTTVKVERCGMHTDQEEKRDEVKVHYTTSIVWVSEGKDEREVMREGVSKGPTGGDRSVDWYSR